MVSNACDPSKEFFSRGSEIYDRSLRVRLEPKENGKFVAIDIETGNWEVDADDYTATQRLLDRIPDARIWLVRVGSPAAYRMGGSRRAERTG